MCGKWSRAINSQGVQCYSLYVGLKTQVRQSQAYASSVFCLRPSHWWRNTRSSKTTSLCRTPSGWLKMTVSRRLKRVSFYITSRISLLLLVSQWERTYVTVSSAMQCLHMEVIKQGLLQKLRCLTTSLRFSISTVKHDPLCSSIAGQSWAAC